MDNNRQQFEVKAFREGASTITLLPIIAATADEASRRAGAQGYHVIGVARHPRSVSLWGGRGRAGLAASELSAELLALLRAGLNLPEAMAALQQRPRSLSAAQTMEQICSALREGRSFSKALEESGSELSALYIATIRSSEETGNLTEALTRYLDYDRRVHLVRNALISATIYPAILLIVGVLVVGFLLGYVIPRFSRIYSDLGEDRIPVASRILMHFGQYIDRNRAIIAGCSIAAFVWFMYLQRQPRIRAALNRQLWSIPVLGSKLHLYQLARFSHTLAMLLRGGIPFVTSLDMAVGLLQQPSLRDRLVGARRAISQGQLISATFAGFGLTTEVGERMLSAGERTGNMADMMDHIALLYDEELGKWLERFTRLFEPLLMTAIGLTIGTLVLLMYLPIFGLASSIE